MPERADTAAWRLVVDRDRCMGTGTCMLYAPGTLDYDADGKAVVTDPLGADLESATSAVEACPTRALAIDHGVDATTP